MIKQINDFLAGLPMTILGGMCLVISFTLPRLGIRLPVDPAWLAVIICGLPLLYLSVWRIIHNPGISKISSALLITVAMFAAVAIGDLFAAGEVAFIMELGAILEDMTTDRAKKGLHKLIALAPVQGRKMTPDGERLIPADEISVDDVLRVLPGEVIPVDGVIISGETSVDQSIMTGESLPVDKGIGEELFCGTMNRFGTVDMRATKVGKDSSLQKLIKMVQDAQEKQAPMQRIADRAASWLVPAALLIAIAAGLATQNIVRAVTVLVVFCPCALVLATPTAIMAAIGQATRYGVIIKSGEALERMGRVHTVTFDKTGTLTCGKLTVSDVLPLKANMDERRLLILAASAEARSGHPLGNAIVEYAKEKGLPLQEVQAFWMQSGRGIRAELEGKRLYCGNEAYIEENGIAPALEVTKELLRLRKEGKASVIVADETACLGIIALSDTIRQGADDMVKRLAEMNTKTVLLTGDNELTADYFASRVGIKDVRAQLLPQQKVENILAMQKAGECVCMIGDGVNDAPALKTADVGVAMGSIGSDIAIEAADIALMSDDISRIPYLKRLSNATVSTIRLSITLSMCINFVAVACSVLGILTPTTGALVHNAGSCFVVLLAALLYDRKFM